MKRYWIVILMVVVSVLSSGCNYCLDSDGDGYGDPDHCQASERPGYVNNNDDCDDGDSAVNPGVEECDGQTNQDDDCDGLIDEDQAWAPDNDGDGYGSDDPNTWISSCEEPPGYVQNTTDCDDSNPDAYPQRGNVYGSYWSECLGGMVGVDDDCDGIVDEDGSFSDLDGDGVRDCMECSPDDPNVTTLIAQDNYDVDGDGDVTESLFGIDSDGDSYQFDCDCDDQRDDINPGEPEYCTDTIDNDCDGLIDTDDPDCAAENREEFSESTVDTAEYIEDEGPLSTN